MGIGLIASLWSSTKGSSAELSVLQSPVPLQHPSLFLASMGMSITILLCHVKWGGNLFGYSSE